MITQPRIDVSVLTDDRTPVISFRPQCTIARALIKEESFTIEGLGAHQDRKVAQEIARAEAIERFALVRVPWKRLLYETLRDFPDAVDPRSLYSLTPERAHAFSLQLFDPAQQYYWVEAHEVLSGKKVHMIADMCYALRLESYAQRFSWMNSCGVAAHTREDLAEKSALFELCERDAIMVHWMARHQPPRVAIERLFNETKEKIKAVQKAGYACACVDATCRGVPVAFAIAYRKQRPALVFTAAARNTLQEAFLAAWRELEVELYLRLREEARGNIRALAACEVYSVEHHSMFYSDWENAQRAAFLWQNTGNSSRDLGQPAFHDEGQFDLQSCCQKLYFDTMYKVNYGSFHGLKVIRLLCPRLVPLLFGFNQFPFDHPAKHTAHLPGRIAEGWPVDEPIPPHPLA